MGRLKLLAVCAALTASAAVTTLAQDKAPETPPVWAWPGTQPAAAPDPNKMVGLPGSAQTYSDAATRNRLGALDWFPNAHPPMPVIVQGHNGTKAACGFCHMATGVGRPESADLAGMPANYLIRQMHEMKSGARALMDEHAGPQRNMITIIKEDDDSDFRAAADYFSKLRYPKRVTVVETAEVPKTRPNGSIYEPLPEAGKEPIGQRIIEVPVGDFANFKLHDPRVVFTAYVPIGAIARGAALARADAARGLPACESCHGAGLKGGPIAPPIAGRYATGIFRQLYAFKTGARNGVGAGFMAPVVANMSQTDMIDVAAYVASRNP
jgi:cytochrome c553